MVGRCYLAVQRGSVDHLDILEQTHPKDPRCPGSFRVCCGRFAQAR